MKYRVVHRTEYTYQSAVSMGYNEAHLTPRGDHPCQRVRRHRIEVSPQPDYVSRRQDFFGNEVFYFVLQRPHARLVVVADSEIERLPESEGWARLSERPWEDVRASIHADTSGVGIDVRSFVLDSPLVSRIPEVTAYAAVSFTPRRPFADAVEDFVRRVHQEFTFDPAATTVSTPVIDVFRSRRGVCQDFAHLMIAGLRGLGLAARYVSGYLETLPPPGMEKLIGSDASHAWVAVYEPGIGWSEHDPTNDIKPSKQHIVMAMGRDYSDITPLKGVVFGGGVVKETVVGVDVQRLDAS